MIENEVTKALLARRSVRKFKPEQIKDEELETVVKAGLYAPSARSQQSWLFVVVQDKKQREAITELNKKVRGINTDPYYEAPTVILVFAEKGNIAPVEDASLALGNMFNAAYSIGLASCWIHREHEMFETEEGKALMKQWGVGEEYFGVGSCALGYYGCDMPKAPERREGRVINVK